ncbi:hypothetical protein ESP57_13405 [Agromyces fucosus]|uniref:DUF3592 domain-containing protein n=1 Tax=Agromyces fucosus TaxID=41985 RepID=A0A4Q2JHT2_9MICO|nr:hypothetical protein [Agromyces fucosus]RXZ47541.1 hypothetical protein ESP57_13405 [Agromyces fucosus]
MSLTDPSETRRLRTERRRPVVRNIVSAVLLASFATAGFVWGRLFVDGIDTADAALQVVAIVSGIIAWGGFLIFSIATFGSWRNGPLVLGLALFLLGAGLAWPVLQRGASLLDFPGWLGLLFIAFGVFVWVMTFVARGRQRRRSARELQTLTDGVETTATVTRVPPGPNPSSRGLWAAVTFTFTDASGAQRWVERTMLIRRAGDVKVGDTTRLWYDRADPGADRGIVVELARDNPLRMAR